MHKLRAYWRAFRGYCPNCNLDAPAIDHCPCCENYRGTFPPAHHLAAKWLYRYLNPTRYRTHGTVRRLPDGSLRFTSDPASEAQRSLELEPRQGVEP